MIYLNSLLMGMFGYVHIWVKFYLIIKCTPIVIIKSNGYDVILQHLYVYSFMVTSLYFQNAIGRNLLYFTLFFKFFLYIFFYFTLLTKLNFYVMVFSVSWECFAYFGIKIFFNKNNCFSNSRSQF